MQNVMHTLQQAAMQMFINKVPYSLQVYGSKSWTQSWEISPQVTKDISGGRLPLLSAMPSQLQTITAHFPVPNYTSWWQKHTGVDNLLSI